MKAVVQIKWILFSPSVVDCIAKTCFAVLQCFDAVGWSEVQTCIWPSWCHCHSLSLASVKSRLVLPFWYRLTWVVPEEGPLNGCVWWVCVCFAVLIATYLVICPLVGWIRCASCCTVFVCEAKVTLNLGSISDYKSVNECFSFMLNSKSSTAFVARYLSWNSWNLKLLSDFLKYTHAHAHTRLTALFPGLPRWASTRKINQSGFYWSKRQWVVVASAGPHASPHLAPDR